MAAASGRPEPGRALRLRAGGGGGAAGGAAAGAAEGGGGGGEGEEAAGGERGRAGGVAPLAPRGAQQRPLGAVVPTPASRPPQVPGNPARRRARELAALQRVHPNVLARVLKQGAVYQDEEVVVLNKPYGLPVHGEGRPGPAWRPSHRVERLLGPLVGSGTLGGGRKHPQTQRMLLLLCYRAADTLHVSRAVWVIALVLAGSEFRRGLGLGVSPI